ncbi:hypothetical protein V2J09_000379 [Rumex salicifolius]
MMRTKNLVKLANKWKRIAAASRKRISFARTNTSTKSSTAAADKDKFAIYTTDERRFALPLGYLESQVVRELLRMAEEEFGLGGDGRITLPCDSAFLEYAISMIQKIAAREMEEALILSLLSDLCSSNSASSSTHISNIQFPIICQTAMRPPQVPIRGREDDPLQQGPRPEPWTAVNHAKDARPRVINQTWDPVSLELKDTEVRAYRTDPVQIDGTRIMIPLAYLKSAIFKELPDVAMPNEEAKACEWLNTRGVSLDCNLLPTYKVQKRMISTKKLIKMAKKWQRLAAASRKRISTERAATPLDNNGHFVVYIVDARHFALPLAFLDTNFFRELLRMAEEEFGLASDGPITLPCDSVLFEYALSKMISTKNLVKLARKWRKIAVASRKRISFLRTNPTKSSAMAEKGQFVVYTADEVRFALPLEYLGSQIVMELLRMAEEEFGLGGDGRITLPCDSAFMEYAISMIQQSVGAELEEALILSLSNLCNSNSASSSTHICNYQLPISCSQQNRLGAVNQADELLQHINATTDNKKQSEIKSENIYLFTNQSFFHLCGYTDLLNDRDGVLHESRVTWQSDAAIATKSKLLFYHSKEFYYYSRLKSDAAITGQSKLLFRHSKEFSYNLRFKIRQRKCKATLIGCVDDKLTLMRHYFKLKSNGPIHSLPTDHVNSNWLFKFVFDTKIDFIAIDGSLPAKVM